MKLAVSWKASRKHRWDFSFESPYEHERFSQITTSDHNVSHSHNSVVISLFPATQQWGSRWLVYSDSIEKCMWFVSQDHKRANVTRTSSSSKVQRRRRLYWSWCICTHVCPFGEVRLTDCKRLIYAALNPRCFLSCLPPPRLWFFFYHDSKSAFSDSVFTSGHFFWELRWWAITHKKSLWLLANGAGVLPWGEAGFAALAAAGVDARPIVEETAQGQLLPDRLPLILLGLQRDENQICVTFDGLLLLFRDAVRCQSWALKYTPTAGRCLVSDSLHTHKQTH